MFGEQMGRGIRQKSMRPKLLITARDEEPADVESITINSPMTKLDSHRISERLSAKKNKNPSPMIIRPKKATQVMKDNQSDDSSVEQKPMRSTAKVAVKSFNTLEKRAENTQESNFQPFAFPRKDDLSSDVKQPQDRSEDIGRKIEIPVTHFDLRTHIPEKSPTTKAPESCQKADNRSPTQFNLAMMPKEKVPVESRRNSLAPGDCQTPLNSSQKKDFSRKSVHAVAMHNAAHNQHLRSQSRSMSRNDHDQKDSSMMSAGSGRSGKPDSSKGLLTNEANNYNLIQKGANKKIPTDTKSTKKQPDNAHSVRRNSTNLSQHQQSEDSSKD